MEKKTKEMMEQFIAENINRVPRNQSKKFEAMTIEQKVERIQMYIDREKMWEEAAQKRAELAEQRKLSNKVKELMTRRHATIQDAQEIIAICQEFINNYKDAEMARIDEEIAKLMAMKQSIENN
jgi:hypothetical protein